MAEEWIWPTVSATVYLIGLVVLFGVRTCGRAAARPRGAGDDRGRADARLGAQSAMGASWRIGVDRTETTTLVTGGIFSRVRNPIFTAMITAQAGTVLMAPSWVAITGLVALVTAIELQVRRVEEPYLAATHGTRCHDYTTRVGRFVPLLGRHNHRTLAGSR